MNTEKVTAILVAGWFGLVAAAQTVETVVPKAEDLSEPYGVAIDLATNLYYFSDSANHRILRFDPVNKDLLVVAGLEAGLFSPHALAMGPSGLLVADSGSHVIRLVGLSGGSSVVAGRPGEWGHVDGAPGVARFHAPSGVTYAPDGSVYVADSKNSALRRIAPDGEVSTVAAGFFEPAAVAVAPDGRIFVADTRNHVIKAVTAAGVVSVIAGETGVMGSRDGAGGGAQFNRPRGLLWVGGDTGLLVADSGNNTIRRVSERGGFWRVDTFAGSSESAALVDGDLKTARFFSPMGLAVDAEGAVVVADLYNNALRRINRKVPPAPVMLPAGGSFSNALTLAITSAIPSTVFRYTTNGLPVSPFAPVTGEWLTLTGGPVPLQVRGYSPDYATSPNVSNYFTFFVDPISVSVPGGAYSNEVNLAFVTLTEDVVFRYSTNSLPPTTNSPVWRDQVYETSGPLQVQAFRHGFVPSPVVSNVYQFAVAAPSIDPPGAVDKNPVIVRLATETRDATIYWTLDNSDPTPSNGNVYLGPFQVSTNGLLKVRAYRDHFTPSVLVGAQFAFTVADPTVSPPGATANRPVTVELSSQTEAARLYWTINGGDPTTGDQLYTGPFVLSTNGTLRVRGFREGFNPSITVSNTFNLAVSPLSINLPGGTFNNDVFLSVVSPTPGAQLHYVTAGNEVPSAFSPLWTNQVVDSTRTLQIQGFLDGLVPSPVLSNRFEFQVAPLKIPVTGGTFDNTLEIPIGTLTSNVQFRYTLNGIPPDAGSPVLATLPAVSGNGTEATYQLQLNSLGDRTVLQVQGYRDGYAATAVSSNQFILKVAAPVIEASVRASNGPVQVAMSTATTNALIYWAIGRTPTPADNLYTGPFTHRTNGVLQARAFRDGFVPSDVVSESFDLVVGALSATERVRNSAIVGSTPGLFYDTLEVRVASSSVGVGFHYTTDGFTPPSPSTPVIPLRPDEVGRGEASAGILQLRGNDGALSNRYLALRVQGFLDGLRPTAILGGDYQFNVGPLRVVRGPAGIYQNPVEVRMSTVTTNARLHYTLSDPTADAALIADGYVIDRTPTAQDPAMAPTSVRGEEGSAGVLILSSNTPSGSILLSVAGYRDAFNRSTVTAQEYRFVTATPTISASAAVSNAPVRVTLASETGNARIFWAVNREPTTNDNSYTGPFDHTANGLLQARAFRDGFLPSEVASQNFELRVSTPAIAPQGLSTNDAVLVTITSATPGADIRWTIDGEAPTLEQGMRYVGPFLLGTNGLLQARAYFASFEPSSVAGASFDLRVSDPVVEPSATRAVNTLTVTMSAGKPSDTIRLTRDGSSPGADAEVYSGPLTLRTNTIVTVQSVRAGFQSSQVRSYDYRIQVDAPKLTPASGYFPDGTTVALQVERSDAEIRYTLDGSDPSTNSLLYTGPFRISQLNTEFPELRVVKARAFAPGTEPSEVATGQYSQANVIGFARDTQYAAGVGSTVVLPVVVMLESNVTVRSLQFRVEVTPETPGAPNLTGDLLPLAISSDDFVPLKVPASSGGSSRGPSLMSAATYKLPAQPTATDIITNGLVITALGTNANLEIQEFDTITLVAIPIPRNAQQGQVYRVGVVAPTATSDGAQSTVVLQALAPQRIVVTNVSYLVGDAAPGRWYNAGDFGDGTVDNADVNLAMSASLGISAPFPFTDVHDALDAYPPDNAGVAGGDGEIRFLDWQLILRRSLGLDTNRWYRSWGPDGVRRTQSQPSTLRGSAATPARILNASSGWARSATVGAVSLGRVQPGQTARVPVYVRLATGNALKGLQFRARVTASAGSTSVAARFVPAAGVPEPMRISRLAAGEVAGIWALDLNGFSPALEFSNVVGYVEFGVPEAARSGEHFLVQFFGVDGAPDGSTQYEFETVSGSVWVGQEVPEGAGLLSEEWKAAYFSSGASQVLGTDDADGDGALNWQEYLAGSNPTDPRSALALKAPAAGVHGNMVVLRWDTLPGKRYQIESTADPGVGPWRGLGDVVDGTGAVLEVQDAMPASGKRFYRVRLIP